MNNNYFEDSIMIGSIGKISIKKTASKIQNKIKNTAVIKKASEIQNKAKNLNPKKVLLSVPRRAFRTLIAINFNGLANTLNSDIQKAKSTWDKLGGSWAELEKSISVGIKRKPLVPDPKSKLSVNGLFGAESTGSQNPIQTIETIFSLAKPIIELFKSVFQKSNFNKPNNYKDQNFESTQYTSVKNTPKTEDNSIMYLLLAGAGALILTGKKG
jgi:hypothetical protein